MRAMSTPSSTPAGPDLLLRWVQQPANAPVPVLYLRRMEHAAALHLLGTAGRVLDVASEVSVTRRIRAREVARLDFSADAASLAARLLPPGHAASATAEPAAPRLPWPDGTFDAAISVGPYDLKLLDLDALTAEVRRVLRPGGRLIVTLPTPRSPYCTPRNRERLIYYPPEAIDARVRAWGMKPARRIGIHQSRTLHRGYVHRIVPRAVQWALCIYPAARSVLMTLTGRGGAASYEVLELVRP